ncbi:cytochrome C oxidase subunit IV family protein [Tenacibaculum insulae]|uniref:cytochrome C oxidase subunit IV family protein n=1 Tax=Tenacibaculum insulae TaxID=2029677 RepID=UPI003AB7CA74
MNKLTITTWVSLVLLTIVSALFSNLENNLGAILIIGLATLKFLVVGFQFMEIKKAHTFWKVLLLFFIIIYAALVLII